MDSIDVEAQENHRRIVFLKTEATRSFILLGKELLTNQDKRYFEPLGYPTFEAYIESPAVGLSRSSVYSLIAIYETFVLELGYSVDELKEVDYSKLDRILPILNVQPVGHQEWFLKAKTLPRRELEREVRLAYESQIIRRPKPLSPELPKSGLAEWVNTVQCGDALELLRQLPDESIDCCITSPPYWALRDYGVEGQLGTEETFHEYIERLCTIFDDIKRVLKTEGTCWVNLGDTYSGTKHGKTDEKIARSLKEASQGIQKKRGELPDKCLLQIPNRFAIEMCHRGWILRNEIIWYKPNGLPSSATDRFTVDFEKLFFFTKSDRYWFETQREEPKTTPKASWNDYGGQSWHEHKADRTKGNIKDDHRVTHPEGRNKRCVWTIPTQPFPEAHFAVFPEALVETPILAGCQESVCQRCGKGRERIFETGELVLGKTKKRLMDRKRMDPTNHDAWSRPDGMGATMTPNAHLEQIFVGYTDCGCNAGFSAGIVLDPFCGSGTTLLVAKKLNRPYLGFDLNPDYVEMARRRLLA